MVKRGLSWRLSVRESTYNVGNAIWIPGLGRFPGEGSGNPLHYSGLENPMDRGVWQAAVDGVAKGRDDLMTETLLTSPPR